MESLDRLSDTLDKFMDTFGGGDSGNKGRHRKGRHGNGNTLQTPTSAKRTSQNAWKTSGRLKRTSDNIWRAASLVVLVFVGASLIANFLQFAPLSQAILVMPVVLLGMVWWAEPTAISSAFLWSKTEEIAERVAATAGYLVVVGLAIYAIPLHALPGLVVPFGVVLSAIGLFKLAERDSRISSMLWLIAAGMVIAFFVADIKPEASESQEPAVTSQTPVENATPAPPPTSGQVEHVVTPRGNGGATSSNVSTGTAGASTASAEAEMPEPSRQVDPEPEANIIPRAFNEPYIPKQGETVQMTLELSITPGGVPAKNVKFREKLPKGLSYAVPERCAGKTECSWNIGDISSGQAIPIEYQILAEGPPGLYTLIRSIEAENAPHLQGVFTQEDIQIMS